MERLLEDGVGRTIARPEFGLVPVLLRADALGHERPAQPVGTTELPTRCGVDRRTRDGARRQAIAAVIASVEALVGRHVIPFGSST
ncbi:peptidase S1 and S6, chymotrypsin/Hap domain protein [Mycobacterium intracellulare MIN_052511_1280]|nr:peptidase S1 and S6, chymotrypsin/Hap domain protein [Mycobacterium intracellulare MIN_052511_1280]